MSKGCIYAQGEGLLNTQQLEESISCTQGDNYIEKVQDPLNKPVLSGISIM